MSEIKFSLPTIRLAMPMQVTPGIKDKMREEGWFVDPEGEKSLPSYVRKQDLETEGLGDFVEDLSLFKLYKPSREDIKDINGGSSFSSGRFIVINTRPAKTYTRLPANMRNYVDERKVFPGDIKTINIDNGDIVRFGPIDFSATAPEDAEVQKRDLANIFEQIKTQSKAISLQTLQQANQAIRSYNERLEKADEASANLTVIPLQLDKVRRDISARIQDLDRIIEVSDEVLKSGKPSGVQDLEKHMEQQISSGVLAERDFKDNVLSKYYHDWERLVNDLNSTPSPIAIPTSIPNPEEFKRRLLSLGELAFKKYMDNKNRSIQPQEVAQQFDIESFDVNAVLQELSEDDISYSTKSEGYGGYQGFTKSWWNKKHGSELDRSQLQSIATGIDDILNVLKNLPAGTRGETYLKTEDGQAIVNQIKDLCQNKFRIFVERYRTQIVNESGKIDLKKLGPRGTTGNGLIVISLLRIWAILSKMFRKLGIPLNPPSVETAAVEQGKEPTDIVQQPTQSPSQQTPERVSSSTMKIKISKTVWKSMEKTAQEEPEAISGVEEERVETKESSRELEMAESKINNGLSFVIFYGNGFEIYSAAKQIANDLSRQYVRTDVTEVLSGGLVGENESRFNEFLQKILGMTSTIVDVGNSIENLTNYFVATFQRFISENEGKLSGNKTTIIASVSASSSIPSALKTRAALIRLG